MIGEARTRHAIAAALVTTAIFAAIGACSSDSLPPAGDEGTTSGGLEDGGSSGTVATVIGTTTSSSSSSSSSTGGTSGSTGSVNTGVDAGPPCLGDAINPDAGAAAALCPTTGACAAGCTFIANNYRPAIAQVAAECIVSQAANCTDPQPCLDSASVRACPVADAQAFCTPLVKPCDPNADTNSERIGTPACLELANALTSAARTDLANCILGGIDAGTCPDKGVQCIVGAEP